MYVKKKKRLTEVSEQREEAAAKLVVPHLDFVIITAGHEQRLRLVEVNAAHGPIVLLKPFQQSAHAVIPELDHTIVQTT